MRVVIKYLVFIIAIALPACARERATSAPAQSSSSNQASSLVKVENVSSYQEALSVVSATSLECAKGATCPAFVGMFLAADKAGGFSPGSSSVAACTAVLVGEDLVLTNSHCIPSAVKLLPDLCSERIRVVLPASGAHLEESLACASLLGHSERVTPMSPDLALLRLEKKTSRSFPALNRAGISSGSTLRSLKVTPDLKQLTGLLREENCLATARSYRMPVYTDATSPSLVLGDCEAVAGNSGGALLDSEGRLAGLMQADLPLSENARRDWAPHLEGRDFARLAMGTSLLCLEAELPAWQWNSRCVTITEQDVALSRPRIREQLGSEALEAQVTLALAPFVSQTPLLRWERSALETRPLRRLEALVPLCLAPGEDWVGSFTHQPEGDSLLIEARIELELPRLSLELRFNRFLQPLAPRALIAGTEKKAYTFSPKAAFETGGLVLKPELDGEDIQLNSCLK